MRILHIVPGLDDPTCGIAVAAKMIAARQGEGAELVDSRRWTRAMVESADEVWVHSMWTPGVVLAAWCALRCGKRLVRMPHGCMDPVKLKRRWWKKALVAPLEKRLFRRADSIVATDGSEEGWIRSFAGGGVRVSRVSLRPEGAFAVRAEGRAGERLRVLYVGRFAKLKGVRYLLQALPEDATLVMIGKDEGEEGVCRRIAAERKLDVEFRGVVGEEEKCAAYDWCDVLVLPTLSENFGLVVAEALERGKRVITTDGAPAWSGGERGVVYLEGYKDGRDEERVEMLRGALARMVEERRRE
ncbi:MAG: glycosyltransferase [Kiritimatiellae bacterium]|nr:glycosyltransferase [Kiritimatiellia bacterium]